MIDYLSFAGSMPLSDSKSSDLEVELNVAGLALEEEPMVQFNNLSVDTESLATTSLPAPEASKKRPQDIAPDEEELIEGSGLFVKRSCILGCSDTWK